MLAARAAHGLPAPAGMSRAVTEDGTRAGSCSCCLRSAAPGGFRSVGSDLFMRTGSSGRVLRVAGVRAVVPSQARSYTMSRGRTLLRTVVPSCARSYLRAPGGYDCASPGTTARARVRLRVPGYDRAGPGTTARSSRTDRRPPHSAPTHSAPTGSRLAAARSVTTFAQSCRRGVVACTRRPHPARHGRPPPVRRPASRSIVEQGPYSTYRARIPNPDS